MRNFANERFFDLLRVALRDRAIRAGDTPLTDPMQLQPFFRPPIDPAILTSYEIAPDILSPRISIAPRAPVDLEYDIRRSLFVENPGSIRGNPTSMTWVGVPRTKAYNEARAAYQAANGKSSTKTSDLLPYATDPTSRDILATYAAYENAHDGKYAPATANLLPYAVTPEIRTLFESMIRSEERGHLLNARK